MANATQQTPHPTQDTAPGDGEIEVRAVGQGPLARLTSALGRAVTAAGEALYDYSGGEYGLHPMDAAEIRHERKRPRPVAVVEVRESGEEHRGRAWLPVVGGILGIVVGAAVVAIWQRRRLQSAAQQAVALGRRARQQAHALTSQATGPHHAGHAVLSPTPAAGQMVRGAPRMNGAGAAVSDAPRPSATDTEASSI
jgi:hypothetical protein